MNSHLTDEQLVGYVHSTLTDADRETMSVHLSACAECRGRRDEFESLQNRIRHELVAEINAAGRASAMRFSTIVPQLGHRSRWDRLQTPTPRCLSNASAFVALAGLVIAILGLVIRMDWDTIAVDTPPNVSYPMFACGCFVVSLVGGYRVQKDTARLMFTYLLAFALWLGTALVGLQVIVIVLDLITWGLHMNVSSRSAIAASWALIPLGVAWVALVVGGGEYHFRHLGRRRSWLLFGFTVLVEMLILCIPFLATWANSPIVWR
jgi:hypothetical protein